MERKAFLTNPKDQYRVYQCGKPDCSVNNRKNEDYYGYPSLSHRKAFPANPKHQSHAYQCGVHDCSANNKKTQVCLISLINFNYKETGGNKSFLENSKH